MYWNAQLSNIRKHFVATMVFAVAAWGQLTPDKVTVPLTDPTRPAMVKVNLLAGSITVRGYEGKDVIVEARARAESERGSRDGMRRVPINSTGLAVEEENNQVDIGTQSLNRPVDITVQVPFKTSLHLRCTNDGDITVTKVEGEIDVNNTNGAVTLKNIAGNAVAHALNDNVVVTFDRINPTKPMAFSSMNGDVDVTFPADLKATLSINAGQGDVLSDFDIQLQARAPAVSTETAREKGRFRVKLDKSISGTINGGGQAIQLKNFNGNIYIRKTGATAAK